MNAVACVTRDVGPVRELSVTVVRGGQSRDAIAKYFVSYPSIWHRDQGINAEVTVLAVTYGDGVERKSMTITRAMRDFIAVRVEALELELN